MAIAECEVIIVGAGPVGLLAALRLSHLGVSCVVLEAEDALSEELRASTFHPPTLEILEELGLADDLLALGRVCRTWQIRRHPSHERVEFDLSILNDHTPFPFRLQCEQFRLSRLLFDALAAFPNTQVLFSHRVTDVANLEDGVRATIETPEGEKTMTAKYAIGADGGRSTVRKALGMPFEGRTYPETTILVTTTFPFHEHLPGLSDINYVWKEGGGTFSLLHLPDVWRCSLYPENDETVEQAMAAETIERKLQAICRRDDPYPVGETRAYRIHMRIVDDYRRDRVLLAGDAAHLNSPSGGMGMNGGLHDAYFLAEAIASVLKGGPTDALDHYTRRRRPVALQEILAQADSNRRRMRETDPAKRQRLFDELAKTANDRQGATEYLLQTSMIAGWRQSLNAA